MQNTLIRAAMALGTVLLAAFAVRAENVDLSTVPTRNTVQLTIYNSEDLTLVRETRKVSFKPGTTLTTRRCSGSKATWSQLSPCLASSGLTGSQCFSFLPTNDHFSSNCTSRVSGGNRHEFVVELSGVVARQPAVTHYRVPMDAHQAAGFADAAALGNVFQDRADCFLRQGRAEQRGPLRSEDRALQVRQRSIRHCLFDP